MTHSLRAPLLFAFVAALFILEGTTDAWIFSGSWNTALGILNMALISAIMALGVNLQWGYAGLFNIGVMGFVALGGLATVLVSMPPAPGAWAAGGAWRILLGLVIGAATVVAVALMRQRMAKGRARMVVTLGMLVVGFFLYRSVFDGGVEFVESITPAATGHIGGLNPGGAENYRDWGWLTLVAWPVGGLIAAGAAWIIGKTALGLRSDYLAIATLGIAEIVIAIMKNEDWLARGVKNVIGLPRPVPYEVDLQADPAFAERAADWGMQVTEASTLFVKLNYMMLFTVVLVVLLVLAQLAYNSPWGRMMRAIRDNEVAAEAMGKDVTARHLQIFILGSAICGIAGAMMTTLDGQLTPSSYQPLRYTFLIWVMVIVGGSGNNFGAILGGFLIYWLWIQVEPIGQWLSQVMTSGLAEDNWFRIRMTDAAAHMRLFSMGLVLLLVLRFSPKGLLPEK
ncbi:branched-chain amino acid ABC transporter permease [Mesobacterium sp. TK19101]|uniref:Branched-chain amino acid ABC transporter permease n=1 Tax=Mesobacterium hydrothermale TaxID=3111907 RepID=A0ABU6HFY1_9RHOB|nr:branched-chain amino acid ABC transporter permease [Mesobacterium sp. TK19101]MEC3860755.1 branched-chain amino acid ABC transporter permease [Mesobacterium sp. TK19101]